jgi:hypothetical protein
MEFKKKINLKSFYNTMFAKFCMLKSPQGTKRQVQKCSEQSLLMRGYYNIPLNIAHLIAQQQNKNKNPNYCTPFLHTKTLNYCTTLYTQDSNSTSKNPKCSYGPRKVKGTIVCAKKE